jgi:hypothetical protein
MSNNNNNQTYTYISDDVTFPLDSTALPSLTSSDIVTIGPLGGYDYSGMNSIGNISITGGGTSYTTINNSSSYFGSSTNPTVNITENGVEMAEGSDIKIGDRSLKTFMDTMEKRLAILQPNPKKLEKFEALQKAYNHYKMLESLCDLEDEDEQK